MFALPNIKKILFSFVFHLKLIFEMGEHAGSPLQMQSICDGYLYFREVIMKNIILMLGLLLSINILADFHFGAKGGIN